MALTEAFRSAAKLLKGDQFQAESVPKRAFRGTTFIARHPAIADFAL
jgi:hypothetical protein